MSEVCLKCGWKTIRVLKVSWQCELEGSSSPISCNRKRCSGCKYYISRKQKLAQAKKDKIFVIETGG